MWSRRADTVLVAVSVSVLVGARALHAQGPDLTVERRGPARVEVTPGTKVTFAFQLTNNGLYGRTIQGAMELPESWRLVVSQDALRLAPRASELALMVVTVPASARAGGGAVAGVRRAERIGITGQRRSPSRRRRGKSGACGDANQRAGKGKAGAHDPTCRQHHG